MDVNREPCGGLCSEIIAGELTTQPQEVLEARFFSLSQLPTEMLAGHRQQIEDAINGISGAVWTHHSEWQFQPGLNREDLYRLRDQSGMSPADFYLTHIARPSPPGD